MGQGPSIDVNQVLAEPLREGEYTTQHYTQIAYEHIRQMLLPDEYLIKRLLYNALYIGKDGKNYHVTYLTNFGDLLYCKDYEAGQYVRLTFKLTEHPLSHQHIDKLLQWCYSENRLDDVDRVKDEINNIYTMWHIITE
jgi:hypothetical protein